ncbi:pilus assembly protein CpaE [Vibrio variabilis]|uniref:Pilus assembly protein CpaE n=1 Tax=Vibrio variabilis TaxID=990271 RepID=A0ABR4Y9T1_9VIBR|nr:MULTISPECIES: TadE/TadG family type IV pilus assembly protein [Vibrio]KHA60240.1 pilus assembly protein CpaE [Vibrio variabilis]KHT49438.1 pilus assembly protein CpaE [Vibrio sinaloensis]KIE22188.1 pilus assembly protein CpaE [Vibrio sinaloensis]
MKKQSGVSVIEFTIISTALLLVIFSVIEVGRYVYSLQVINDITRVAARLAVVCRVEDRNDIPALAMPDYAPGGLTTANLVVDYLDESGNVITGTLTDDDVFSTIRYVRARVVNFSYQFTGLLTFVNLTGLLQVPEFETIRPRENLGHHRWTDTSGDNSTDC